MYQLYYITHITFAIIQDLIAIILNFNHSIFERIIQSNLKRTWKRVITCQTYTKNVDNPISAVILSEI